MEIFYNIEEVSSKLGVDISSFTDFEKIITLISYNLYHIVVLFFIITIAYKLFYKIKNIIF